MENLVKIFTTGMNGSSAGDDLTKQIEDWQNNYDDDYTIEIVSVHSNSNNYGWMIVLTYNICDK